MKKYGIFALVLLLALSMCACRFGRNDETTEDTRNQQQTDSTPVPTIIDPPVIDPTIDTNVPDPSVDNDHMIDDTGDIQGNGTNGNDSTDDSSDPLSRMRRRMR